MRSQLLFALAWPALARAVQLTSPRAKELFRQATTEIIKRRAGLSQMPSSGPRVSQ